MSRQVEAFPDPLTFLDGRRVADKLDWLGPRRAELRRLFESEMYGKAPDPVPVTRRVLSVWPCTHDRGLLEQWHIRLATPTPHRFDLLVATSPGPGPFPVIVCLNFHGNHTVTNHQGIFLPDVWVPSTPLSDGNRASGQGRGDEADDWQIPITVGEGFVLVTAYCGAIEPDYPEATKGVRTAFGDANFDWGTVSAWAWGLSRILDALLLDPRMNPNQIGVAGHSRLGKAALLAAAFDERFAFAAPVQAGCGGTAPSRGTVGESVRQITHAFPHWFNSHFSKHGENPADLPFDQNCLLAMVAPRPLLLANATEDEWANPEGQLEALEDADRVYRLLGEPGLAAIERPIPLSLTSGNPASFMRPGTHRMGATDWAAVREFALRHLR